MVFAWRREKRFCCRRSVKERNAEDRQLHKPEREVFRTVFLNRNISRGSQEGPVTDILDLAWDEEETEKTVEEAGVLLRKKNREKKSLKDS